MGNLIPRLMCLALLLSSVNLQQINLTGCKFGAYIFKNMLHNRFCFFHNYTSIKCLHIHDYYKIWVLLKVEKPVSYKEMSVNR